MNRRTSPLAAAVAIALVALGFLAVAFVNADLISGLATASGQPKAPRTGFPVPPERFIPILFGMAALCVVGLAWRSLPAIRGLALVMAAMIGSVEIIAAARAVLPYLEPQSWAVPSAIGSLAAVAAVGVAAAYLVEPRSGSGASGRWAVGAAVVGLASMIGATGWAIATAMAGPSAAGGPLDAGPLREMTRLALGLLVGFAVAGALRDVWPGTVRAWARSRESGERDVRRFGVLLADELLPWRATAAAGQQRAAESERKRLAAELHARVLPDLRVAAATAAATPGVPAPLAVSLRHALDDIESLMSARQSVVLEEFGLLAGLEWLAERTEERSDVRVAIEVPASDREGAPGRPPPVVEQAAFRVALLALDNVVRHAGTSRASVSISIEPSAVSLSVDDDGIGIDPGDVARASAEGRRGISDMRDVADSVGARLAVETLASGTRVRFDWPV